MNRLRTRAAVFGLLSLFAFLMVWGIGWAGTTEQTPVPGSTIADTDRQMDRNAIRAMMKEFVVAFQNGDAAAAAAFMTVEAEIITDEGGTLKGRDAIKKAYAEHFAKTSRPKVTLDIDSVRFTSRDTAIEDGEMAVSHDSESPVKHRYQILYAREDGKWLISLVKEWPPVESPLSELDWLIGTWSAKRADAEVRNTYEWFGNKSFIKVDISVREKDKSFSAMQLIGIDAVTGGIRTWTFEHDGGYGEGTCLQDGPRWVFENRTTLADGSLLEATNILVPVDRNTITWQPINLTIEGEQFGDLPPVKITRVKK
jgi:uncharacterized protein (TIGR02246 family)